MNEVNDKHTINKQRLPESPFFSMRKNKVKWPTFRHAYLTDYNVPKLKNYVMSKGRSIIFLDGMYETKLNRYKGDDPNERAVFFEYMLKDKNIKGAIQTLVWIGSFNNGSIIHFGPQFPQTECWKQYVHGANDFFERACFKIYRDIANILYDGNIVDDEVRDFIANGQKKLDEYENSRELIDML